MTSDTPNSPHKVGAPKESGEAATGAAQDTTKSATRAIGAAPEAAKSKHPLVLFALDPAASQDKVSKQFAGEGLEIFFAKDAKDLISHVSRPEAFLVFVHVAFANNMGAKLMKELKSQTRVYFLVISPPLSTQGSSSLMSMGASEVLQHPAHPVLMKGRARMILTRFLKIHDFSEDVILPPGQSRRATGNPQKNPREAAQNEPKPSRIIQTPGAARDEGPNMKIIAGEKPLDSNFKIIEGEGMSANLFKIHEGEEHSKDKMKIFDSEARPVGTTEFFEKDETHHKRRNFDDPAEAFSDSGSRSSSSAPGEGKDFLLEAAAPAEERIDFLYADPAGPTTPEEILPMQQDQSPDAGPKVVTTGWLKEIFLNQCITLDVKGNFDRRKWTDETVPEKYRRDNISREFRPLAHLLEDMKTLTNVCCKKLAAARITLISLRPTDVSEEAQNSMPPQMVALTSSDGHPIEEALFSQFLPEVEIAFTFKKAVWIPNTQDRYKLNPNRPQDFEPSKGQEISSAALPLFIQNIMVGVFLVQFTTPVDSAIAPLLEEACSFLEATAMHDFETIDFLSRSYRQSKTLGFKK